MRWLSKNSTAYLVERHVEDVKYEEESKREGREVNVDLEPKDAPPTSDLRVFVGVVEHPPSQVAAGVGVSALQRHPPPTPSHRAHLPDEGPVGGAEDPIRAHLDMGHEDLIHDEGGPPEKIVELLRVVDRGVGLGERRQEVDHLRRGSEGAR